METATVDTFALSRQKSLATDVGTDTMLGHVIVILQYDWPRGEETFSELLERIRDQGSFKYSCFFDYVINILSKMTRGDLSIVLYQQ